MIQLIANTRWLTDEQSELGRKLYQQFYGAISTLEPLTHYSVAHELAEKAVNVVIAELARRRS
jgi:hypothetical protein